MRIKVNTNLAPPKFKAQYQRQQQNKNKKHMKVRNLQVILPL